MLINIDAFKEELKTIKKNNFTIANTRTYFGLTKEMLQSIGSPDPELRDKLIYSILSNWIMKEVFTHQELREILRLTLDDKHLFYLIGENEGDSVFTRSFSVLLIPPILFIHRKHNILSKTELQDIFNKVLQYAREEKDLRGYIEGKGWAHSVAHTADALDELALCKEIERDGLLALLDVIKSKISEDLYAFTHEEDERLVTAVVNIIKRTEIKESEISNWIESFKELQYPNTYIGERYLNLNIKNFLRSLYFRLLDQKESLAISTVIIETLDSISNFKD